MEAVLDNKFITGYQDTRENIHEELKSRIDNVTLNTIKKYLRDNQIEFDGSSIDLDEFKKKVIPNLSKDAQAKVKDIEKKLNTELAELADSLHAGSETAFTKFATNLGAMGKSAIKLAARTGAIRTAALLGGPVAGTVVSVGAYVTPMVISSVKRVKGNIEKSKITALDSILLELTSEKDKSTNQTKFILAENVMKDVADNLKQKGIEVNTSDVNLFVKDIIGLDSENKENAIEIINSGTGNRINVKQEKYNRSMSFKKIADVVKKEASSILSSSSLIAINLITKNLGLGPHLTAALITTLTAGALSKKIMAPAILGGAQLGFTKGIEMLSNVDFLKNWLTQNGLTDLANKIVTDIPKASSLVATISTLPIIIKGIRSISQSHKVKKEYEENKDNLNEKIAKELEKTEIAIDNKSEKDIAMEVVVNTLRARGINVPANIHNKEQLQYFIKGISSEDKKEIKEFSDVLERIQRVKNRDAKSIVKSIAKAAYWGGTLALAGLSAYELFVDPEFLDLLANKDQVLEDKISEINSQKKELAISDGIIETELGEANTIFEEASSKKSISEIDTFSDPIEYYMEPEKFRNSTEMLEKIGIMEYITDESGEILEGTFNQDKLSEFVEASIKGYDEKELANFVRQFGIDYNGIAENGVINTTELAQTISESPAMEVYFKSVSGLEISDELLYKISQSSGSYSQSSYRAVYELINNSLKVEKFPSKFKTPEEFIEYMNKLENDCVQRSVYTYYVEPKKGESLNEAKTTLENEIKENDALKSDINEKEEELARLKEVAEKIGEVENPRRTFGIRGAIVGAVVGIAQNVANGAGNFINRLFSGELFKPKDKLLPPAKDKNENNESEKSFLERIHVEKKPQLTVKTNSNRATKENDRQDLGR